MNMKNSVFWDMTPQSGYKYADISEEPTASVVRLEDSFKMSVPAVRLHGDPSQKMVLLHFCPIWTSLHFETC